MTTPAKNPSPESGEGAVRVSLDDIKHRAQSVSDLAVGETKAAVGRVMAQDTTKLVLVAVGVVVVAASLAYFAGSRRGRGGIDLD